MRDEDFDLTLFSGLAKYVAADPDPGGATPAAGGAGSPRHQQSAASAPQVAARQQATGHLRFWIDDGRGKEQKLDLPLGSIAVAEGHRVTAIIGHNRLEGIVALLALLNHQTGRIWEPDDAVRALMFGPLTVCRRMGYVVSGLGVLVASAAAGILLRSVLAFGIVLAGSLVFYFWYFRIRYMPVESFLRETVQALLTHASGIR